MRLKLTFQGTRTPKSYVNHFPRFYCDFECKICLTPYHTDTTHLYGTPVYNAYIYTGFLPLSQFAFIVRTQIASI